MNPRDDPQAPPPNELPRPRPRSMSDVRRTSPLTPLPDRPQQPRPLGVFNSPVSTVPVSPTTVQPTQPPVSHPGDHLLESPHESLLGPGEGEGGGVPLPRKKHRVLKTFLWVFAILIVLAIAASVSAVVWYNKQLTAVNSGSSTHVRFTVATNSTSSDIASNLKIAGLIRSKTAFMIYLRLHESELSLKAGAYSLSPQQSLSEIVAHLNEGKSDTFRVTFLPGDTLANNRKKLIELGYTQTEIDAALAKTYDRSALFAGKPASSDLEGYIYGETYEFDSSATVEDILNRTFDEYEKVLTAQNIAAGFKNQGLTLYQGITLASIVQREVTNADANTANTDQKQVAAVFYNRLKAGMTLGSDVTYQYAAKKLGVDPTPTLDSLYNTRIHTGLPPGPIAVPSLGALEATAYPGSNNYLFFLSGDDDVMYYATTDAEHQENISSYCHVKCSIN